MIGLGVGAGGPAYLALIAAAVVARRGRIAWALILVALALAQLTGCGGGSASEDDRPAAWDAAAYQTEQRRLPGPPDCAGHPEVCR